MKTECPRCKTTERISYSLEPQEWRCLACGHEYIVPASPPKPLPKHYRVCDVCCDIVAPFRKENGCIVFIAVVFVLLAGLPLAWGLLGLGGLVFVGIMAAVIVTLWSMKPSLKCPKCDNKRLIPMDSPKGMEIIEKYNLKTWVKPKD